MILCHIGYIGFNAFDNFREFIKHLQEGTSISIINSPIVVDIFFTISGFLLALGVENAKKQNTEPLKVFWKGILNRYLRLIIPYIPAVLILMTLAKYFETASPYLPFMNESENCQNHYWRNWLFIHNLYPFSEICFDTTWYLGADFQLYIILLTVMAFRMSYPKIGDHLLKLLFVMGLMTAAYVGYVDNFSFYIDVQLQSLNSSYFPFWIRMAPYLVGVGGGLLYNKLQGKKLVLNRFLMNILWIFILILGGFLYSSQNHRTEDRIFGAAFLSLGRSLWAVTIVWWIVTTAYGYGGVIGRICSYKCWIPISRISYSTCLMNQLVLYGIGMASDKPFHYDVLPNLILFMGYAIAILFLSLIFNVLFEFPFIRLIKLF
uniref:CSON013717 protein n=1 Tax=Culicoides sonorensis TaxID=179676 RepID=A0A336KQG6_CULSO